MNLPSQFIRHNSIAGYQIILPAYLKKFLDENNRYCSFAMIHVCQYTNISTSNYFARTIHHLMFFVLLCRSFHSSGVIYKAKSKQLAKNFALKLGRVSGFFFLERMVKISVDKTATDGLSLREVAIQRM